MCYRLLFSGILDFTTHVFWREPCFTNALPSVLGLFSANPADYSSLQVVRLFSLHPYSFHVLFVSVRTVWLSPDLVSSSVDSDVQLDSERDNIRGETVSHITCCCLLSTLCGSSSFCCFFLEWGSVRQGQELRYPCLRLPTRPRDDSIGWTAASCFSSLVSPTWCPCPRYRRTFLLM